MLLNMGFTKIMDFWHHQRIFIDRQAANKAPDAGDSGAIPSILLHLSIFPVGRRSVACPSAGKLKPLGAGNKKHFFRLQNFWVNMTTNEVITICISVAALIVSLTTLYFTVFYKKIAAIGRLIAWNLSTTIRNGHGDN